MHPLALKPFKGGPKNLPILERSLEDLEQGGEGLWGRSRARGDIGREKEEGEVEKEGGKPRLVILGGGWGVSALCFGLQGWEWRERNEMRVGRVSLPVLSFLFFTAYSLSDFSKILTGETTTSL